MFDIPFFFESGELEVGFDGNPYKRIIFFLVVKTLVFMTALLSDLLRCS